MKFVIDKYIPFIEGVLEPYGEVVYASPEEITPELVRDADCLLVRTRTRIDGRLLGDSRCRFVATATIGMDHFDTLWCAQNGVTALNAPGCNAPAVAQYVLSAIAHLGVTDPRSKTLAVVGVGHVGRIVSAWAQSIGFNVMHVDPPRQRSERAGEWWSLTDAARLADIITFHTPLNMTGEDSTYHLADKNFFDSLKRRPLVINAARGAVVDNAAWLEACNAGRLSGSVIDVWEGEPSINRKLMNLADIATPHIAGYSLDGKIRATRMVLDAVSRHFGLPRLYPAAPRPEKDIPGKVTLAEVMESYNPLDDTAYMRKAVNKTRTDSELRKVFEELRDKYPLRDEP